MRKAYVRAIVMPNSLGGMCVCSYWRSGTAILGK
jgi:hypothetical protein